MHEVLPSSIPRPSSATPRLPNWIVIAAAIYLALPFDICPGLGMIGDLTALYLALSSVKKQSSPSQEV